MPGECIPQKDKVKTGGFKYRVSFICEVHHTVQIELSEYGNTPVYYFRSRSDCDRFVRQLVWPARVEVFKTSKIRYMPGGREAPVTLNSPLVLQKRHTSDSSPTIAFKMTLQSPHETITYYVREFASRGEVLEARYPELSLRFNAAEGRDSRSSSKRKTEKLYRGLSSLRIKTDWEGLSIQFRSANGMSATRLCFFTLCSRSLTWVCERSCVICSGMWGYARTGTS